MSARRAVWIPLVAFALLFSAGRSGAIEIGIEPTPELPRLFLVVRGHADVTLTDPAGRVNAVRDSGLVDQIPDCKRIEGWKDPNDSTVVATAFEISNGRTGLYAVRVRARESGTFRLDVTATPKSGLPCSGADLASLRLGERLAFSVAFEPATGEGQDGCTIRAAHRLAPPPPKKKK